MDCTDHFSKLNREKQWIAQIIKCMSCEKSERVNSDSNKTDEENLPSVKWPNLCWHLEIKYQTNYLIAAKQAGMPILSTMVLLAHPI